jgi:hypothetical protein
VTDKNKLIKSMQETEFYIQFADKIPEKAERAGLFHTDELPKNFEDFEVKKDVMTFVNIHLPRVFTIQEFKYLIARVLSLNTDHLRLTLNHHEKIASMDAHKYDSITGCFKQSKTIQLIEELVSIGNIELGITIVASNSSRVNNYEKFFYENYKRINDYIIKINRNIIDNDKSIFNPTITQITVSCLYKAPIEDHRHVDICALFNLHIIDKFVSKIYLQSKILDAKSIAIARDGSAVHKMYVKTSLSTINVFKGLDNLYNSFVMYVSLNVASGIILRNIVVNENMTVQMNFTNSNTELSYTDLTEIISKWLDESLIDTLSRTCLSECVYSERFQYEQFIPFFTSISGSLAEGNIKASALSEVSQIFYQRVPVLKFQTNTSLQFNGYTFYSTNTDIAFKYLVGIHDMLTLQIIQKYILPVVHVGISYDSLSVNVSNAASFDELVYNLLYVISNFKLTTKNAIKKNEPVTVESILAKARSHGKKYLKTLTKADSTFFGPRIIKNTKRSYSGLTQRQDQRVVMITEAEYEILREKIPESVANIKNLTFPNQRLCLVCPFKRHPFLNFHIMHNQPCIARCTTKSSNKTQYDYCARTLDVLHKIDIQNKFENQTVVLYNPLITRNRRCRLPNEIAVGLENYVLLKLPVSLGGISAYCKDLYHAQAFIIRRNPSALNYLLITEFNVSENYVLVMQSEANDECFIFLHEHNSTPIYFNKHPHIKKFFIDRFKKTESQYKFFNYLELILKIDLNNYFDNTNEWLFDHLVKKYHLQYIVDGHYICGIIWKNILYICPRIYWIFTNETSTVNVVDAFVQITKNKLTFPKINHLNLALITEMYKDLKTKLIHVVCYNDVYIPVEKNSINISAPTLIFDYEAYMNSYLFKRSKINLITTHEKNMVMALQKIIHKHIFIFLLRNKVFDKSKFKSYLEENKFIGPEIKINTTHNIKSWRNSVIDNETIQTFLAGYNNTIENSIKIIYKILEDSLTLVYRSRIEKVETKLITGL